MGVEVPPDAQQQRQLWRFQFSAFAVQEKKNPPGLEVQGGPDDRYNEATQHLTIYGRFCGSR